MSTTNLKKPQIAAPFSGVGDPRSAMGGKAKKRNRIGRESALATCRRMNFDCIEQLILIAQRNEHALGWKEGEITAAASLSATKEVATYIMVKKQNVAIVEGGGSSGGGVEVRITAPVNTTQGTQIQLEDGKGTVIEIPPLTQDNLDSINDGIIEEDFIDME
jgi:hypothetical protein